MTFVAGVSIVVGGSYLSWMFAAFMTGFGVGSLICFAVDAMASAAGAEPPPPSRRDRRRGEAPQVMPTMTLVRTASNGEVAPALAIVGRF